MVSHSVMFRICIKFQTEFSEIMWRTWPWRRSTLRPRRTWPWRSSTSRPRGCEGGKEQKLEREYGRSSARAARSRSSNARARGQARGRAPERKGSSARDSGRAAARLRRRRTPRGAGGSSSMAGEEAELLSQLRWRQGRRTAEADGSGGGRWRGTNGGGRGRPGQTRPLILLCRDPIGEELEV
jgi:hypothetical protein